MADRRPVRNLPMELGRVLRPEESRAHQLLHDRLAVLAVLTFLVWAGVSLLMYLLEHRHVGTSIRNGWEAAYWTASQLTAVGSSYANPLSPAGHVLDILIKIYAVVVVATLAGTMGAFFMHRREQEKEA